MVLLPLLLMASFKEVGHHQPTSFNPSTLGIGNISSFFPPYELPSLHSNSLSLNMSTFNLLHEIGSLPEGAMHTLLAGQEFHPLIDDKARRKQAQKSFKVRSGKEQMVLGLDVQLARVAGLAIRALIVCFEYTWLKRKELLQWLIDHWASVIGYAPRFSYLINGWVVFHFLAETDVSFILSCL